MLIFLSINISIRSANAKEITIGQTEAYIRAGQKIEQEYKSHIKNLTFFYNDLKKYIKKNAPELVTKLSSEPPAALDFGYQVLPKIIEEPIFKKNPVDKFITTTFSWVNTGSWLQNEVRTLRQSQALIANATKKDLIKLIKNYKDLDSNQKIIGSQIQYNFFWQKEITQFKSQYDKNTKMYDDLVAKNVNPDVVVQNTLKNLMSRPGAFISFKKNKKHDKILAVKMLTDVADMNFIRQFKSTIEKYWQVRGPINYSIKLELIKVTAEEIYKDTPPPLANDKIDLLKHIEMFPEHTAILTSGSGTTYAHVHLNRRYIVFGPNELSDRVLAHEFGHILSLPDAYFRGYRDLGKNGFEVLEIVPDLTDLMSAPGMGVVKTHHFEAVIEAMTSLSP